MRATVYANPGFNGTNDRMTWEDIIAVHNSGIVEIGAHTMTHQKLPEVAVEIARAEIEDSKGVLEHLIDAPVVSFAYPFGARNSEIANMVYAAGFKSAVVSDRVCAQTSDDIFSIPRIRMGDTKNIEAFAQELHL
jgi:peptidoglycan/xylan/chitin deacetylase (PgdA/CDA1 family)